MADTTILNEIVRSTIDGSESVRLATTGANWRSTLSSIFSALLNPLVLTKTVSLNSTNPVIDSNATYRRAAEVIVNYNALNSQIGFTDQLAMAVTLNFNSGVNVYGAGTNAKYTPIAFAVSGNFTGAGEKFLQDWNGEFYSMGDAFLWTSAMEFAGGPIGGDEGQGMTPAFTCNQLGALCQAHITAVARTGYSTTVTANVTGSYVAQAIPVASTVGAVVGDWVILNQSIPSSQINIWAMQITAINPGVSITGICAINMTSGQTVTPALVINTDNQYQFGEQRVLVNLSSAGYSTGLVASVSGGGFIGSGTTWSNGMVGGSALNIGVIYLDVDTLTAAPFSVGSPLKSYYQITTVASSTSLGILSTTVAGDASYHGRGEPPAANMTYKVLPAARILLINPPSGGWNLICETSTHTWTVGNLVECALCPYPDMHGFDLRMAQWTPGGTRRSMWSLGNNGARMFGSGLQILATAGSSLIGTTQGDAFAFGTGIALDSCQTGISIFDRGNNTTVIGGPVLSIRGAVNAHASDVGSAIQWQNWGTIQIVNANNGMDWVPSPDSTSPLRFIGNSKNVDGTMMQMVWPGYLQIASTTGVTSYLRLGGGIAAGASIDATLDLNWNRSTRILQFILNQPTSSPTAQYPFSIGSNWAGTGVQSIATSNTTNWPSNWMRLTASVWNAGAANNFYAQLQAVPGSGVDDAPITMQIQIWDNVNNNASFPNVPFEIRTDGLLKFGNNSPGYTGDRRVTLDAISNITATRIVKFLDTAGDIVVAATNTTGAGSAALGANSPAVTNTAPYTWLQMKSHDGSTVYVPAWK